jgi:hypothetical protein
MKSPKPDDMTRAAALKALRVGSGVIDIGESFTAEAFCDRMAITSNQFRRMRDRGLKARKDQRFIYVLGSDWFEYLSKLPVDADPIPPDPGAEAAQVVSDALQPKTVDEIAAKCSVDQADVINHATDADHDEIEAGYARLRQQRKERKHAAATPQGLRDDQSAARTPARAGQ